MAGVGTYMGVAAPAVSAPAPEMRRPQVETTLKPQIDFQPPVTLSSQFQEVNQRVEKVQQAISEMVENKRQVILNSYVAPSRILLDVFEATGDLFAKVVHSDTGDLLRTLPPMAVLEAKARMDRYLGLLLDQYA